MKFIIKHEIQGRMRIHVVSKKKMTHEEADILEYYFHVQKDVTSAKVYNRIGDIAITYTCDREELLTLLKNYQKENVELPTGLIENSGRALNEKYKERLLLHVLLRYVGKLYFPAPIRYGIVLLKAVRYIIEGLKALWKRRLEVSVLDATAIVVSLIRRDFETAGSIMFLLGIGEQLEEWTHKKSVDDLARTMSLNINKVWLKTESQQILVSVSSVNEGDEIVVHMGNIIPFDGYVAEGEAMVNQSSLTGESVPIPKDYNDCVYAGSVVESGELTIRVTATEGKSRYDRIVTMIEETEKLKSAMEGKAVHLADQLVPCTLGGAVLTYFFTRNVNKMLSVLLVDFSCALKLAMPITVLSAIREARMYDIVVKGGKYLEGLAEADTIVFDKTGTLTKATPTVVDVVTFDDTKTPDEILRIAACLEEHFPHSMAKAVVDAANAKNLEHNELHTKAEYVVAHGISTTVDGKKTILGSRHFVFEDEKCIVPEGKEDLFHNLPAHHSHLFLAVENVLVGVVCIEDPIRGEAADVIQKLRETGFWKVVIMTGDSERTAASVAKTLGVHEYYSEVLPEDKANYILEQKALGRKVVMVGDGINDSPALSAADVGIAISDGAEIAREIADITVGAEDLYQLVTLRKLSNALVKRIRKNYREIVGINGVLIGLGVAGIITPTTSAMIHNTSTLLIGVNSMTDLLEK